MRIATCAFVLLLASGFALAEDHASKSGPTKSDERKAKLVAGVKSFSLTLDFMGLLDPKVPRWSLTLSTEPVYRLASEPFHEDVVIDEKQALKIIDWLEKDGFLARAVDRMRGDLPTPTYMLQVTGGGIHLEGTLGWNADMLRRLDSLAAVLEGDAAKAMQQVIAALADVRPKLEAAERVEKLKADLASFALDLRYVGDQDKPYYGMTISTRPMMRDGVRAFWVEAVIDVATAKRIVESLAASGVLGRAEDARVRRKERPEPAGPCYVLDVGGADIGLEADLGWGKDLALELFRLRGLLGGEAGKQMDVLLGRLSGHIKEWTGEPYAPPK